MITGWRLTVWDRSVPTALRAVLNTDDAILAVDYASVGGDGDCRELAITAKAGATGIRARDIVTLYPIKNGALDSPLFSGIVTMPGAQRGHETTTIRAVGWRKRVYEVGTGADTYAQQDIALIVRDLAASYPPNGVTVNTADIPTLAFEASTEARYNRLGDLLDDLAALCPGFVVAGTPNYSYNGETWTDGEYVPPVTWGVDANRRLFFRRAGKAQVTLTAGVDVQEITSIETAAERLVTQVHFLATGPFGLKLYTYNDTAAQTEYGRATDYVSVATVDKVNPDANYIGQMPAGSLPDARTTNGGTSWTSGSSGYEQYLLDDDADTGLRDYLAGGGIGTPGFQYRGFGWIWSTPQAISRVRVLARNGPNSEAGDIAILIPSVNKWGGTSLQPIHTFDPSAEIEGVFDVNQTIDAIYIGCRYQNSASGRNLQVYELQPLTPDFDNIDALDRTGAALVQTPSVEAVEAFARGDYAANPLTRTAVFVLADGTTLDPLDILDVEHRFTTDGWYAQRIRAGAAETAEDIAQATLIRAIAEDRKRSTDDLLAAKKV